VGGRQAASVGELKNRFCTADSLLQIAIGETGSGGRLLAGNSPGCCCSGSSSSSVSVDPPWRASLEDCGAPVFSRIPSNPHCWCNGIGESGIEESESAYVTEKRCTFTMDADAVYLQ